MQGKIILLATMALAISIVGAAAVDKPVTSGLKPVRQYEVKKPLQDDDGKAAMDVSGIACMPAASGARHCLVVNDEDRSAQFATVDAGTLTAGDRIALIGKKPSGSTVGKAPTQFHCPNGEASFKDLDGEAVAYAAPFFYVAGSHGCARHAGKFRLSAFITARVRVDDGGRVVNPDGSAVTSGVAGVDQVQTTYRLSDALAKAGEFGKFFGRDLKDADGLNVEGIAVAGNRLFAGLRAPSIGNSAAIVEVSVGDLFAPGEAALMTEPRVTTVPLGADVGIRDLAALPDGRLLILSGPTRTQSLPYGLFVVDPQAPADRIFLATFEDVIENGEPVKAEAVLVLGQDAEALTVLLMFDGVPSGGAREYRVPLK